MRLSYNVYDPNNTQGKFTFDQNRGSHTQLPGGTASEAVEMLQCRADPACKDAAFTVLEETLRERFPLSRTHIHTWA